MSPVRLRFMGAGDAFAAGGRFNTCFHLDGGGDAMLIDCGATSLIALKRARIDPASIGWVAVSHLHGDHFGGLPWLILDGSFSGRERPLVIAGPEGTEERLNRAFDALYPGSTTTERPFEISFRVMTDRQPLELGPATVTPFEVIHSSGAPPYALRVEYAGKVVTYSGDTEWTDSLLDAARGSDVFVCECNFFTREVPGHLNYTTLRARREEFDSARLIITHMSREMLDHLDEVEIEAAADGTSITLEP